MLPSIGKAAPRQDKATVKRAAEELAPHVAAQVDRIVEAVNGGDDRVWWTQCVKRLGPGFVDRGLGLLKEAQETRRITNPGGFLTGIFKKLAVESGVSLG